ncbi:MAG: amidohydrolase family protein [Bacteroidetes bacterium]|nr:amidohydrolase family protein [Bacteroidota bacterium]
MLYDLLISNLGIVKPNRQGVEKAHVAVKDGRIAAVAPDLDAAQAAEVYDGGGLLAFPGLVDAHMHTGIYNPLAEDAVSESRAAAMGGVTTSLNYIRTGKYYLNKSGPYAEFFPEVLDISRGRYHVDYAYHIAPIQYSHIDEIGMLIDRYGVTSFKIFMFYGNYGLHGKSSKQQDFLMTPDGEYYDYAHFEFIMRGIRKAMDERPDKADHICLGLHCETAEIMRAYSDIVQREGKLKGLRAYSAARPPHSEGLAIFIASYLAHETDCANINLLHLTSAKAVDAAMMMQTVFPHIRFKREVTLAHLILDYDCECGLQAKVNPPIRSREDVEYLWDHLLAGNIDWVCSDHACCKAEFKTDAHEKDNVWLAKSGFGGTEFLLSGLYTEGRKRGLSLNRMAELLSWNPAQRFGLPHKGDIAPGFDADIVLMDPDSSFTVDSGGSACIQSYSGFEGSVSGSHRCQSASTQGYSVFEGYTFSGPVKATFLRGALICKDGQVLGEPQGSFLHRPY